MRFFIAFTCAAALVGAAPAVDKDRARALVAESPNATIHDQQAPQEVVAQTAVMPGADADGKHDKQATMDAAQTVSPSATGDVKEMWWWRHRHSPHGHSPHGHSPHTHYPPPPSPPPPLSVNCGTQSSPAVCVALPTDGAVSCNPPGCQRCPNGCGGSHGSGGNCMGYGTGTSYANYQLPADVDPTKCQMNRWWPLTDNLQPTLGSTPGSSVCSTLNFEYFIPSCKQSTPSDIRTEECLAFFRIQCCFKGWTDASACGAGMQDKEMTLEFEKEMKLEFEKMKLEFKKYDD